MLKILTGDASGEVIWITAEFVISDKKVNYCYFCPGDQSNTQIHRHLRDSHANEIEVLKATNEKDKKDETLRISMLMQKEIIYIIWT